MAAADDVTTGARRRAAGDTAPATHAAIRRHAHVPTTLGDLLLVAAGDELAGVYFPDHRYPPAPDQIGAPTDITDATRPRDPVLGRAATQLREYLAGQRRTFQLPLRAAGDAFAQRVWALLCEIPYGSTTTYGELADRLGDRRRAQAVGQAVGHNPLSIVVPCHRVLGADGGLRGFAGGLDRKRALLALEQPVGASPDRLF